MTITEQKKTIKPHDASLHPKGKGISIRPVIFVMMMFGVMGPLTAYEIFNYNAERSALFSSAETAIKSKSHSDAAMAQEWIMQQQVLTQALAQTIVAKSGNETSIASYLGDVSVIAPEYSEMFVTNKEGMQIVRSNGTAINIANRSYFQEIIAGANVSTGIDVSEVTGKAQLSTLSAIKAREQLIASDFSESLNEEGETDNPVASDGIQKINLVGMLGITSDLGLITQDIEKNKIGKTGVSFLINANTNEIITQSDESKLSKQISDSHKNAIKNKAFGTVVYSLDEAGKPIASVAHKINDHLTLITKLNVEEIENPLLNLFNNAVQYAVIGLLISLVSAFFLSSLVSMKISRLANNITELSRARNSKDISMCEQNIHDVGGFAEIQNVSASIKELMIFIKSVMRSTKLNKYTKE